MMRHLCLIVLWSVLAFAVNPASANTLLSVDAFGNRANVTMDGNANRLVIDQSAFSGELNSINLTIAGDLNGGPEGKSFSGPLAASPLTPGMLSQTGSGNRMNLAVLGSNNLFAFAQTGTGNALTASITGQNNQASVVQVGMNNIAGFSQSGIGNMVSITQRSY